jgi:pilus assembly protein CpaB
MAMNVMTKAGKGGRPYTLLGGGLAAISLLVFVFLGSSLAGSGGGSSQVGGTVTAVVATHNIPIRSTITPADVTLAKFASTDLPAGSFTKLTDAENMVTAVGLVKGEPLSSNLVVSEPGVITGGQSSYLPIPQGFVALTLPTSDIQGVAGFIQANDYIQVVVSTTSVGGLPRIQTVFSNLHVIKLGPASDQPGSGGQPSSGTSAGAGTYRSYSEMTVVATQCDAEFLYWFLANSSVKYTLASFHDYQPGDTKPDPSCPGVSAAHGVSKVDVDTRWPGLVA